MGRSTPFAKETSLKSNADSIHHSTSDNNWKSPFLFFMNCRTFVEPCLVLHDFDGSSPVSPEITDKPLHMSKGICRSLFAGVLSFCRLKKWWMSSRTGVIKIEAQLRCLHTKETNLPHEFLTRCIHFNFFRDAAFEPSLGLTAIV